MKKKYLPLYYKWVADGEIPTWGLCGYFGEDNDYLKLLLPKDVGIYWGHEFCANDPNQPVPDGKWREIHFSFTPLRQNIVLFMACLNNEL